MSRTSGSTKQSKFARAQRVLDILAYRDLPYCKLIDVLMQAEPDISKRTAERAIADARAILAEKGSECSPEALGLLHLRLESLYASAKNSDNPDPKIILPIIKTQLKAVTAAKVQIARIRGANRAAHDSTAMSPELRAAIERAAKDHGK